MSVLLKITKTTFGGEGVAFHEGKVCFVQGAIPGETVEGEVTQDKKNFLRVKTIRVIEASPDRVSPPCPHYGFCGGCQYQHVSYEAERRFKQSQVSEVLERLAGVQFPVSPMLYSEKEYGYRNSVTFHLTRGPKAKTPVFSFVGVDNISPIIVKQCDILDTRFQPLIKAPLSLKESVNKISFKLSENSEIVSDKEERFFRVVLNGEPIIANSKGFFQTNLRVTELLADKVKGWVDKTRPEMFFDLYAGVGTFSWLCAKKVPKVFCVEESPFSVTALRMNKEEKHFESLEIVPGRVENIFPALWARVNPTNAVILMDPPRQGLEKDLAQRIASLEGAKSLIYISCDIPTLARDLKIILSGGRFTLNEVVPFDMFPRTKHIEAAAYLSVTSLRGA